jgi:uncharacterized protein YjbJ (UPF0337 family)
MPTWLIIVIVVLALLALGGVIARTLQLKRNRPAFERSLTQADQDLAAAAAADRGWDRAKLEAAARAAYAVEHGGEPDSLTLVEVLDRPGTDEAKGRVKEAAGDLSGDDDLKREGKVDKASGTVKDKVGDASDKVKDVVGKD